MVRLLPYRSSTDTAFAPAAPRQSDPSATGPGLSFVSPVGPPDVVGEGSRTPEAVVVAGMLALLWLPSVRLPAPVAAATGVLASASLYVYLVHWQVYPHLEDRLP